MRIAHNIPALRTTTALSRANKKVSDSSMRLSSGVRINSAKDDAAGLAVSRKLKIQIAGLEKASQNATDGISLVQTAEGALNEINSMLQRMRELALQASNGTLETDDRIKIQEEVDALVEEISAITDRTEFNKTKVLNGQASRLGFSNNVKIADVSYVSDTTTPGTLSYTIESVGLPAQLNIPWADNSTTSPISGTSKIGIGGTITLNGEVIEISKDDTYDNVIGKLKKAGEVVGADVIYNETSKELTITSKEDGSSQHITLELSNDLLTSNAFGIAANPPTEQGKDAVISDVKFTDINGNPDDKFMTTKITQVNGNRVTVTASDGRKITMDIQFKVGPNGSFTLNGASVDSSGIASNAPFKMSTEIMDYGPLHLQIGPNSGMEMEIIIPKLSSEALGLTQLNYQTIDTATLALKKIDDAMADVVRVRSKMGAYQNRLEYTILSLDASAEASETSRSRIEDTDVAKETTAYTLQNVLVQAGISILAQANQRPQQVLSLMS